MPLCLAEVRSELPKALGAAKEMYKTLPLTIDKDAKEKDLTNYKADSPRCMQC